MVVPADARHGFCDFALGRLWRCRRVRAWTTPRSRPLPKKRICSPVTWAVWSMTWMGWSCSCCRSASRLYRRTDPPARWLLPSGKSNRPETGQGARSTRCYTNSASRFTRGALSSFRGHGGRRMRSARPVPAGGKGLKKAEAESVSVLMKRSTSAQSDRLRAYGGTSQPVTKIDLTRQAELREKKAQIINFNVMP